MFRNFTILRGTCAALCLSFAPWSHAFAGDRTESTEAPAGIRETIRHMSFETVELQERGGQSVATTTESKLLLGIVAGSLIVGGMTMMAYGASSSCKGKEGASTGGCDKTALVGAMSFSGGAAMALLWALSRD